MGETTKRETDTARDDTDARDDACSMELRDVVETALAEAVMLAARAGRWGIVERIAAELRDRRVARSSALLERDQRLSNPRKR